MLYDFKKIKCSLIYPALLLTFVFCIHTYTYAAEIYIDTKDGNGAELTKAIGYVDASIRIIDEEGNVLEDDLSQIKVRGNSTADAQKKPYTFKLSSKQNVLGMGKAKKWCLLANCYDPTLIRNWLGIELAKKLGLEYTSEQRVVDVYLDGKYIGCYNLIEPVDVGSTRVDINPDNGDYLLEYEAEREEVGETYFVSSLNMRFNVHEPEAATKEQLNSLKRKFDELDSALLAKDSDKLKAILDMDSFAKYYLLNEYIKPVDVALSSIYIYIKDGKFYAGPAWDYDLSSGNANRYYLNQYTYFNTDKTISYRGMYALNNKLFYRLMEIKEFSDLVISYFNEYKPMFSSISSDNGYIDNWIDEYRDEIERNFTEAGWDVAFRHIRFMRTPDKTYAANVSFLKSWLTKRLEYLSDVFAAMEGHTLIIDKRIVPTYIDTGLDIGIHCADCGEIIVHPELVEKLQFRDVPENKYYTNAINYIASIGTMTGYNMADFGPEDLLLRQDMAMLLWKNEKKPKQAISEKIFNDFLSNKYYSEALVWAKKNYIVTGYTSGEKTGYFGINENITRQDFIKILYCYAQYKGYDTEVTSSYTYLQKEDAAAVSGYAKEAVNWGYEKGIIGVDSLLRPKENIKRKDVAVIMERFVKGTSREL